MMKRKAMIGAIIIALFICLVLHMASVRDRNLFAENDTRDYIEMMGEKYGKEIGY